MYKISKQKLCVKMVQAGIGSAKELSKVSGISVNTLSRNNNGGSAKLATVQALAAALHCDPAELLAEEG
ncbi:MAG: helix-turn-helix transcriptional regulator [Oscillibacter sp.]|nr:helix-turn-helix transcriptional regulator [Oscillibacter sp.]